MPQIEPRMISNQLQSSVFLYTCQSADVMEIIKKSPSKNGSILNGVDDDFSTPFFVFTKYLRNAII